ncbi:MAG TPA: hypothetical protein VJ227_04195 [Patescibacteria group bacterium]|nr:hypothetical protein [Patescibacteria group bacterium]
MSPVELGYSLNGEPKAKVVAEDGIVAILQTPAGIARAKLNRQGTNWLTRSGVLHRLGTFFPDDPPYIPYSTTVDGLHHYVDSIFDLLSPKKRQLEKAKKIKRCKTIQTEAGTVIITAKGYEKE